MQPVIALLLDPYRGGGHVVTAGEVVDRAALVECRRQAGTNRMHHHRQRWQRGKPTSCANCLQDAIAAARAVGVL